MFEKASCASAQEWIQPILTPFSVGEILPLTEELLKQLHFAQMWEGSHCRRVLTVERILGMQMPARRITCQIMKYESLIGKII